MLEWLWLERTLKPMHLPPPAMHRAVLCQLRLAEQSDCWCSLRCIVALFPPALLCPGLIQKSAQPMRVACLLSPGSGPQEHKAAGTKCPILVVSSARQRPWMHMSVCKASK